MNAVQKQKKGPSMDRPRLTKAKSGRLNLNEYAHFEFPHSCALSICFLFAPLEHPATYLLGAQIPV